ncbi:MAG: ABC transporter ATP-binding protein, partial [Dehalococcoidales bacterium]|nr:ABC transporter ATP-binding protein [Dehalococcoidales bacterium]
MRKLIRYLRPFTGLIVAIFVLLFAQAMSDLALPAYMSDIVNIGIQQGGVENAVPQAIRASEFGRLVIFMTGSEKEQVIADYTLLDKQSLSAADYAKYVTAYPALATTPIYRLDTNDSVQVSQLNTILGKYIPVVATIEKNGAAAFANSPLPIPPNTDPFTVIAQLPPAQLDIVRDFIAAQLKSVPESLLKQYSIAYITAEYKTIGVDVSSIQTGYMLRIGLFMLLLTLASVACSVTVGYLSARVAAGLGRDLRRQVFVRVENFSNAEFDQFSTASLITRSTNDITQIQMLMVMLFRIVFYAPILATGGIIRVLGTDRSMLWIIAAAVGAMLTMMIVMFAIAIPKFTSIQRLVDRLNQVTREILTGLMVIRAFNTQQHEGEKFDTVNTGLTRTNLFVNRIMVFMMPMMMLIMNGVMLLIVWFGSHQVDTGSMQVGDMMAFMQYAMQIIFSFLMISIIFIMLPRASVSAQRISEVLETDPAIKDPQVPQSFNGKLKGVVEFQNVSFRYPGAEKDVLKHISFITGPGQTTAFIGSTGSGKSTIVNLIPRFYDATDGRILIDGVDIRNVTQHDLRDKIGYVSQKAVLFSGTIESNIKYANEQATEEEMVKYIETAQALDFIKPGEQGYATAVSQGGTNLSGGQKQRLAIARALAKKPEIYIFDDSLSALDFKTDAALRKA